MWYLPVRDDVKLFVTQVESVIFGHVTQQVHGTVQVWHGHNLPTYMVVDAVNAVGVDKAVPYPQSCSHRLVDLTQNLMHTKQTTMNYCHSAAVLLVQDIKHIQCVKWLLTYIIQITYYKFVHLLRLWTKYMVNVCQCVGDRTCACRALHCLGVWLVFSCFLSGIFYLNVDSDKSKNCK